MNGAGDEASPWRRPLGAFVATLSDGRFLNWTFLALLGASVLAVGSDLSHLIATAPDGAPGSQRIEPSVVEPAEPGDHLRPYLPRTMPLAPGRSRPSLPGLERAPTGADMAAPMTFHMGADGEAAAVGTIAPGTAARFDAFLAAHDRAVATIHLHSPGGSVSDALAMGRALRAAGVDTAVPAGGYCASSCPLVLAAGLHRRAGERAYVGVHQAYAAAGATGNLMRGMSQGQSVSALAQAHLRAMGVDPALWIHAMATPPAQLYVFTPDQLTRYRLANFARPRTRPAPRPDTDAAAAG